MSKDNKAHVQEPVGFMNAGNILELQQGRLPYGYVYPNGGTGASVAVYTTPPAAQPAPVPLTDEQREEIAKGWRGRNWTVGDIIDATEAAHGITAAPEKGQP